jgi:hypothetical protein
MLFKEINPVYTENHTYPQIQKEASLSGKGDGLGFKGLTNYNHKF